MDADKDKLNLDNYADDIPPLASIINYILCFDENPRNSLSGTNTATTTSLTSTTDTSVQLSSNTIDMKVKEKYPWMYQLLQHMLLPIEQRPNIIQILQHPIFASWTQWKHVVNDLYTAVVEMKTSVYNENVLKMMEERVLDTDFDGVYSSVRYWRDRFHSFPLVIQSHNTSSRRAPNEALMINKDDALLTHPYPNLHDSIKWIKDYFDDFKPIPSMDSALQNYLLALRDNGRRKAGEFIAHHPGIRFFLPDLWMVLIKEQKHAEKKVIDAIILLQKAQKDVEEMKKLMVSFSTADSTK
jgi:hypothetical protein